MDHSASQTLAEAEIRIILIRERFYRDSSQWTKMRECYHPNPLVTLIDISWYKGDAEGFILGSQKMANKGQLAMHTIQPVDIVVNGSKAFAQSMGTISTRFSREGSDYDLVSHCRLLSRLECVGVAEEGTGQGLESDSGSSSPSAESINEKRRSKDGKWKMLSLEIIYLQDNIIPVIPAAIAADDEILKSVAQNRKSYQLLAWVMKAKGYAINDQLPGVDRPETTRELLERNEEWVST